MMRGLILVVAALPLLSGGCVARAAWDVATLPVKATGKTVDVLTVSEKERDEKWTRQQRKLADRREQDERRAAKEARKRGEESVDSDLRDH